MCNHCTHGTRAVLHVWACEEVTKDQVIRCAYIPTVLSCSIPILISYRLTVVVKATQIDVGFIIEVQPTRACSAQGSVLSGVQRHIGKASVGSLNGPTSLW